MSRFLPYIAVAAFLIGASAGGYAIWLRSELAETRAEAERLADRLERAAHARDVARRWGEQLMADRARLAEDLQTLTEGVADAPLDPRLRDRLNSLLNR